jgi:hypothetical protein
VSELYEFQRTSNQSAAGSDKILAETATTRLLLHYEAVQNANNPNAKIKVAFVHQRKSSTGQWEDSPNVPLSSLKAGEQVKFSLRSEPTLKLYEQLRNLYAVATKGKIGLGKTKLIVGREEEIIQTDIGRAKVINLLLARGHSREIWNELIRTDPGLATRLSYARIHAQRATALDRFNDNLAAGRPEAWWQDFFEKNTWIFGYGLNYQILRSVQPQPRYGGLTVTGRGVQKGDYLQRTEATVKFTVLVEIKRPETTLLGSEQYRNGAWELGGELTGGVSQIHANCSTWEKEGSRSEENRETLTQQGIFTVQPKGILVIGHTKQLTALQRRSTFEMFRRNTLNPEILTFDELYERAKFIVEHMQQSEPASVNLEPEQPDSEPEDDEIPF